MNRRMRILILVVFAIALVAPPALAGDNFVVVVHENNPVDAMDRKEISKLFLKLSSRSSTGAEAVPIDLDESSPTREAFCKAVHNRSAKAVKYYFQKRRFTVGGTAPGQATSEDIMLRFIAGNEMAIGYVSASTDIEAFPVKVIRITD